MKVLSPVFQRFFLPVVSTLGIFNIAEAQRLTYHVNVEFVLPTYHEIQGSGYGFSVGIDKQLTGAVYASFSLGYDRVNTTIIDYVNVSRIDTIQNFSVAPVLIGLKYVRRHFYLGGGTGVVIGIYHSGTRWAIWPAMGFIFPVKEDVAIEFGAKLIGMPGHYSFDSNTNNFLHNGRYSFASFLIGLRFP